MNYNESIIKEQRYMIKALQKENDRLTNKITELENKHKDDLIKARLETQKDNFLSEQFNTGNYNI
jgi:parvulin-like peptidyl-prolyl isomerase